MPKFFIFWKSLLTGHGDHGQPVLTDKPINYVNDLNKKYSGKIIHSYSGNWDLFEKNPKSFDDSL